MIVPSPSVQPHVTNFLRAAWKARTLASFAKLEAEYAPRFQSEAWWAGETPAARVQAALKALSPWYLQQHVVEVADKAGKATTGKRAPKVQKPWEGVLLSSDGEELERKGFDSHWDARKWTARKVALSDRPAKGSLVCTRTLRLESMTADQAAAIHLGEARNYNNPISTLARPVVWESKPIPVPPPLPKRKVLREAEED